MIALLLYESASFPKECWFHWFVLRDGVTLATWVLAIFALIPLLSLRYVIHSKKRDDQFRLLQWLDSQFNSAAMISARRETGKKMLENDVFRCDSGGSGWFNGQRITRSVICYGS